MEYKIYKFNFLTAVHIGKGKLSDSENYLFADTVFSAICHEAIALGGEALLQRLIGLVRNDELRISDAMPYYNNGSKDSYYIPKPMISMQFENEGDSEDKKTIKKLKFVNAAVLNDFLGGEADIKVEADMLKNMGAAEIRTMATVDDYSDSVPFSVGAYRFDDGWGLYIIIAYESDEIIELIEDLLISLSYSGIGGKRTSGMGRFELEYGKMADVFSKGLCVKGGRGRYVLLSSAMASEEELAETLDEADYKLEKRSGFVASETYSDRPHRKKDIYLFKAGSSFKNTFNGILADVSAEGSHAVYRYAKPVFLEVK